jgi:predicted regulator of amino acid metabolism with ACT domain
MKYDNEFIAREQFQDMIEQKNVVRFPASHGGIIHEVKTLLTRNAATIDALADNLRVDRKTVVNAITHLRYRHHVAVRRYYNPKDRKYYYCLEKGEE